MTAFRSTSATPPQRRRSLSGAALFVLTGILLSAAALFAQDAALTVEAIEFDGLRRTRPAVVTNYLTIREGHSVTRDQLAADEARLRETHFFKEVELRIVPGSAAGTARIIVAVEERRWPFFQFKGGFNELDGWYLSPLGLRFDNLLGRGNRFGFEFRIGDRVAGSRLAWERPFLFGTEYDFGVSLYGDNRQFVHTALASDPEDPFLQEVRMGGLELRLDGNSGIPRFFSLAVAGTNVEVDTFLTRNDGENMPAPGFLRLDTTRLAIGRVSFAIRADTRDRIRYPTGGWWGGLSLERGTIDREGWDDFNRVTADLRRYQRLYKDLVVAMRMRWSHISESAPFFEKFYLGGPNSLRGYRDRSLTPAGYAANLSLGSAELRFPLSARSADRYRFTGVLFADAGHAWNADGAWTLDRLRGGFGAGLRLDVPVIGIVRIDFAWPDDGGDPRVHLALGHTF